MFQAPMALGQTTPSFTPCWCSGGLYLGTQGSSQAWEVGMSPSHTAHFEGTVEASESLN